MKVAFIFPPPWAPWAPSYAMGLLVAAGKKRGHDVIGFDLNIEMYNAVKENDKKLWNDDHVLTWLQPAQLEKILSQYEVFIDKYVDKIVATGAALCGISVNSASAPFSLYLAAKLKKRNPDLYILFGGPDCFRSERGLGFFDDQNVDAICVSEADHVWPNFLDIFENNNFQPGKLEDICYRLGDNSILDPGDAEIVSDLNGLSFADYQIMDLSKYSIPGRACLMMSRGCINRCAYCSEGPNFLKYRYRSSDNLFKETKEVVKLLGEKTNAPPFINYNDSLINGRPEILEEFCDRIISENLQFSWGGMALLRKEMTPELLHKMRKAGCIEIMWGLESGSSDTLKLMRKMRFTPELAKQIIKATYSAGIKQYTNIIVGFPGETEQLFLETVQFVIKIRKYFENIGLPLMSIRRNSYVYDHYKNYKIVDPDIAEKWHTKDNSNNYELRKARRNLLIAIIQDKLFDQGRYKDT